MSKAIRWGAALLTISAICIVVDCLAISRTSLRDAIFNSDVVQPYLVVQSFLSNPASLTTWYHSPAIFAFPDWIIALILSASQVPDRALPFAYAVVVMVAFSLLAGAVARTCGAARSVLEGTVAGASVLGIGWLLSLASTETVPLVSFLTLPAFHGGAVLGALFGAWATAALVKGESFGRRVVIAAVLAALGFSDALSVPWTLLPMLFAVGLTPTVDPVLRRLLTVLPLFAAGLAGAGAGLWLSLATPANADYFGRIVKPGMALTYLAEFVTANLRDPWFDGMLLLSGAAVAGAALAVARGSASAEGRAVRIYIATAIVLAIAFPILSGRFIAADQWRYLTVIPAITLLWTTLQLCRSRQLVAAIAGLAMAAGTIVPALANPFAPVWDLGDSGLVRCLAEAGLRDGYADYWWAKQTIFLSELTIHVAQLEGADQLRFNFNASWFTQRADGGEFRPDFVIVDRLDQKLLAARFGAPSSLLQCGEATVWRYDHVIQLAAGSGVHPGRQ